MQRPRPGTDRIVTDLSLALEAPPTGTRSRYAEDGLVAGRCERCGAQSWPRRSVCHRCGSAHIVEQVLPSEGRLTTWTRVWVPVEGLQPPYSVGLVELGEVQLFGHVRGVDDDTELPITVAVRVDVEHTPPFWFEVAAP